MTPFMHLLDRLGRPLLVMPEKLTVILAGIGQRLGMDTAGFDPALQFEMSRFVGTKSERGGYRMTPQGVAVIPILGTLVNRGAWVGASSGLTSYEGLTHQLKEARKDSAVRGILLDMDTPGGEASGCFDVPDLIRDIRKSKPVFAFAGDMACSAGYAIASAATEIWTSRTGLVGSIGVVMVHMDRSGQLEQDGLKPTIIHAGARKADGNPYQALPKAVRDRLQAEAESLRETFIATVVAGRPSLSADQVRATEAAVFTGEQALAAGLVDGIGTFDRVLEIMTQRLGGSLSSPPGYASSLGASVAHTATAPVMSDSHPPSEQPDMTTTAQVAPAPDHAQLEAAAQRGRVEGEASGRQAERARIAGILNHPEAQGRTAQAIAIATETEMSADEAGKVLAKAPKVEAAKAGVGGEFYRAVALHGGNPKVAASETETGNKSSLSDGMRARFAKGA